MRAMPLGSQLTQKYTEMSKEEMIQRETIKKQTDLQHTLFLEPCTGNVIYDTAHFWPSCFQPSFGSDL